MTDVALGRIVIPGVLLSAAASIASAVWTYYSIRDLKRIESRLRRDEEAFRLAQSPRVAAAMELWSAFCRFEAAVERALYPNTFSLYEAPTFGDVDQLMKDDAHVQRATDQVRAALKDLLPALNKAELLLDATTFDACSELFKVYDTAYSEHALAKETGGDHPKTRHARELERLAETARCRAGALAALKTMIGEETK